MGGVAVMFDCIGSAHGAVVDDDNGNNDDSEHEDEEVDGSGMQTFKLAGESIMFDHSACSSDQSRSESDGAGCRAR
jgi:hypothetical protein